jgi:hypothetical protein
MASTITRTTMTNDTGTAANPNSDGTVLNNAWLQASVYDKVDQLLAGASPYNPLILGGALQLDGQPRCGLQNSGIVSLADSTWTALALDTEQWDIGAMHSTVTNTSRVTIPTGQGGHYAFKGQCGFAPNATGMRKLAIARNGVRIWSVALPGTSADYMVLRVDGEFPCAAGDYWELHAYQSSGGALNIGALGTVESIYFMVSRLF